jgi:hypothetical protein
VDQVVQGGEVESVVGLAGRDRRADREHRLADPGRTKKGHVGLVLDELHAMCPSQTTYGCSGSGERAARSRSTRTAMTSPWVRWVTARRSGSQAAKAASISCSKINARPRSTWLLTSSTCRSR